MPVRMETTIVAASQTCCCADRGGSQQAHTMLTDNGPFTTARALAGC